MRPVPRNGPTTGSLCALLRTSSYTSTAHGGVLSFGQFTCQLSVILKHGKTISQDDLRIMNRVPG
jgi:hypothetical protein